MTASPDRIVDFWMSAGEAAWYEVNEAFDASIREEFLETWEEARTADFESKECSFWFESARTMLGLCILLDQFPRNMFRGDARSFATDKLARRVAKSAISRELDRQIEGAAQQFFYMPLVHSECLEDQERAVRLYKSRMAHATLNLLHARAHREIIRRFGRFPFRNEALGRGTTPAEADFMQNGGYRSIVEALRPAG